MTDQHSGSGTQLCPQTPACWFSRCIKATHKKVPTWGPKGTGVSVYFQQNHLKIFPDLWQGFLQKHLSGIHKYQVLFVIFAELHFYCIGLAKKFRFLKFTWSYGKTQMNFLTNLSKKQFPNKLRVKTVFPSRGGKGGVTSHLLMQQTWLFEAFLL